MQHDIQVDDRWRPGIQSATPLRSAASVSIVISCYTEERWTTLAQGIRSALTQTHPCAVTVVVDHNNGLLERLAEEFGARITVLANEFDRGASGTRNTAALRAQTEFIAFLDDDAYAEDTWVEHLLAVIDRPEVVGAGPSITPRWKTRPAWFPDEFGWVVGVTTQFTTTEPTAVRNVWSNGMLVRRDLFQRMGGFPMEFGKVGDVSEPEDTELCLRLAGAHPDGVWMYVPASTLHHHVPAERTRLGYFLQRCWREGTGKAGLLRTGVTRSVGLSEEVRYTRSLLMSGLARNLRTTADGQPGHGARAAAMVAGLAATAAGFVVGSARLGRRAAASSVAEPSAVASEESSVSLLDIDLADAVPAIAGQDQHGRRLREAWVLARQAGRPVGLVTLEVPEAGLDSGAVARAVREATVAHVSPVPAPNPVGDVLADSTDVTVVICTRERPEELRRAITSLVAQTYRPFRLLVVDNAPETDETLRVVKEFDTDRPIDYAVEHKKGLSRARNAAMARLDGGIVAWLDDDEEADPSWVGEIVRAFAENPGACAVSGVVVPAELRTRAQVWFEQFGGHSKGRGFTAQVLNTETLGTQSPLFPLPAFGAGANMAFQAEALHAIGGFDEALGAGTLTRGGEDTKVFTQLLLEGGTIVYWPPALTRHYHRADMHGLESQLRGYGSGLTAFYTAMVADDPRNLFRIVRLIPSAFRALFGGGSLRLATVGPDFPQDVLRVNKRAMLAGPVLYIRERIRSHRMRSSPRSVWSRLILKSSSIKTRSKCIRITRRECLIIK